jgi:hypothetical protein
MDVEKGNDIMAMHVLLESKKILIAFNFFFGKYFNARAGLIDTMEKGQLKNNENR